MKYSFFILVAAAALSACASSRSMTPVASHASLGHPSITSVSSMDSQRDIVLAVANPLESPAMNAGSSLLGYAGSRYYGAGFQRAVSMLSLR